MWAINVLDSRLRGNDREESGNVTCREVGMTEGGAEIATLSAKARNDRGGIKKFFEL
jgi:hypothetical protein